MKYDHLSSDYGVSLEDDGKLWIWGPDDSGVLLNAEEAMKLAAFLDDSPLSPRA